LKESFPEVEAQVRINKIATQVKVGDNLYNETLTIAGEGLFDVFDFEVVAGDRDALHSQRSVVINSVLARKYFGGDNPINQTISIQLGETFEDFVVAAVAAKVPSNSSIRFYLLISDLNYPKLYSPEVLTSAWFNINPETYIMLREGTNPHELEAKFPPVFKTLLGEDDYNQSHYTPGLQPLRDIHLNTEFPVALAEVNDPKYAYILAAIALLILSVACINFVTLAVGRSIGRAREVGIRKVVGAVRRQLIFQFVGEALLVTLISMVVGIGMAILCLPVFNDLAAKQLELTINGFTLMLAVLLLMLIGIIAGSYPAFVLSAFRPIATLKGRILAGSGSQGLRKSLVGVQLVLSIFLVSSTLIMQQQLSFLQDKNLGFSREQLIVVPLNVPRVGGLTNRIDNGFAMAERFKAALTSVSAVASACASGHEFGVAGWTGIGYTDDQGIYREFNVNFVDEDYCNTHGMQFAAGRNFSRDIPSDERRSVVVNEAFVKEYGWTDAIGKKIPGKNFADHEIIGVVKDFNFESLYSPVAPRALMMKTRISFSGSENVGKGLPPVPRLIIKIKTRDKL
jgi:putative ABC transport system permease protein